MSGPSDTVSKSAGQAASAALAEPRLPRCPKVHYGPEAVRAIGRVRLADAVCGRSAVKTTTHPNVVTCAACRSWMRKYLHLVVWCGRPLPREEGDPESFRRGGKSFDEE